jgi:hypothetical protein
MPTPRTAVLVVAAALGCLRAGADEIYLKSGGQFSGRIISRTATAVEMDIGAGKIGVPMSSVLRIEEGHSTLQEYEERASRQPPGDVDAWITLGDWAAEQGLGAQAREAYTRALAASPSDRRANEALGNMQIDGRWVGEDEGYQARGFVRFEGQWITPVEHEAILRERAAEDQREHQRREGELRAREADARAQEAESRAREAEAKAAEANSAQEGIPLWYGWGAGPSNWSTGQVVVRPLPARPIVVPR